MGNVLTFLRAFPEETRLIGEILIAYGELENSIIDVLTAVLDEDDDTAIRTLFRLRSEGQRLDVADAVARKWMVQQGLGDVYALALGASRRCKGIRNQYAHCTWYTKDGNLFFINLEEAAKTPEGPCMLAPKRIDLPLLRTQREFFDYTEDALIHVAESYRRKIGTADDPERGLEMPKQRPFPELSRS